MIEDLGDSEYGNNPVDDMMVDYDYHVNTGGCRNCSMKNRLTIISPTSMIGIDFKMDTEYPFSITNLHTTPLGIERIRRNLNLPESTDIVNFCRSLILEDYATLERKGKNSHGVSSEGGFTP